MHCEGGSSPADVRKAIAKYLFEWDPSEFVEGLVPKFITGQSIRSGEVGNRFFTYHGRRKLPIETIPSLYKVIVELYGVERVDIYPFDATDEELEDALIRRFGVLDSDGNAPIFDAITIPGVPQGFTPRQWAVERRLRPVEHGQHVAGLLYNFADEQGRLPIGHLPVQ